MEELNKIIKKLINGEIDDPYQLSKDLVVMTAHLYNIGKEVTEAEIEYIKRWEALRPNQKTDKSCDIASKSTPEYKAMENKKSALKMVQELIRSVKKRLAVLGEEKLL